MKQRYFHTLAGLLCGAVSILSVGCNSSAQNADSQHSGSMYILTTPDGANLPASVTEKDFPLLIRLDKDFFDFTQAKPNGEDIRFSTPAGRGLPHEVEQWNAGKGTAIIWVRIPRITGNAKQEIKVCWGSASAKCESTGCLQHAYHRQEAFPGRLA